MEPIDQAKELRFGTRKRVPHCRADNSMLVGHDAVGFHAYCFRCGATAFEPHGQRSIADLTAQRMFQNAVEYGAVEFPQDVQDSPKDWPKTAISWLFNAGLTEDTAWAYSMQYSPALGRVCIPVRSPDDVLWGVVMRSVDPVVKPKYLMHKNAYPGLLFFGAFKMADTFVLCEDILSAIRVSQFDPYTTGIALCGTKWTTSKLMEFDSFINQYSIRQHPKVCVWMDPDKAGKQAESIISNQLGLIGIDTKILKSDRDPKYHTATEIRRIIND